jgi:poly(A) polymerase
VNGEEIMHLFNLGPCAEVGRLKSAVKDAILDGIIPNEHDAAKSYIMKLASEMGLTAVE